MSLRKHLPIATPVIGFYLLLVHWAMGLRPEHILLAGLLFVSYFFHERTRRFVMDFFPMILFGILYDFLRIIPKSWAGPIHVEPPYQLERFLFGYHDHGQWLIPSDFFLTHTHPLLDVLTGLTYSLHMIVPLGFAILVWLKHPTVIRRFNWTFLLVNLMAFATYVGFPSAPPWYAQQFGLGAGDWGAASSAAGLANFDRIIGYPYFAHVYAKNAWIFGAIPSMHAGFPFLVVCYAAKHLKKAVLPLSLFMVFVWFSAVYLRHHYLIDLIAGVLYVSLALAVMARLIRLPHGVRT